MYKLEYKLTQNSLWKPSTMFPGPFHTKEEALRSVKAGVDTTGFKYRVVEIPTPPVPAVSLAKQPHYAAYQPEPITVIEGWKLNYNMGNAIKYISRAGKKDSSVEGHTKDLEKAINYIRREINTLRGEPSWE